MATESVKNGSIPLYVQFQNQESGAYVKYDIIDSSQNHLGSGTISHLGSGLYLTNNWQPSNADIYTIVYSIWNDAGYSVEHPDYGGYYAEQIEVREFSSEDIASMAARHNLQETLTYATSDDLVRNAESGVLDNVYTAVKRDSDSDWSSPIASGTRYFWYSNLGDTEPIKVGEDG